MGDSLSPRVWRSGPELAASTGVISLIVSLYVSLEFGPTLTFLIAQSFLLWVAQLPITFTGLTVSHLGSVSNAITGIAFGKFMSVLAMSLASVYSGWIIASFMVHLTWHKFQMKRVTATPIFTKMINVCFPSTRNWPIEPSVNESRNSYVFSVPLKEAVAVLVKLCDPIPTSWSEFNLRKESRKVFDGKVVYGKVSVSHSGTRLFSLVRAGCSLTANVWPAAILTRGGE